MTRRRVRWVVDDDVDGEVDGGTGDVDPVESVAVVSAVCSVDLSGCCFCFCFSDDEEDDSSLRCVGHRGREPLYREDTVAGRRMAKERVWPPPPTALIVLLSHCVLLFENVFVRSLAWILTAVARGGDVRVDACSSHEENRPHCRCVVICVVGIRNNKSRLMSWLPTVPVS